MSPTKKSFLQAAFARSQHKVSVSGTSPEEYAAQDSHALKMREQSHALAQECHIHLTLPSKNA